MYIYIYNNCITISTSPLSIPPNLQQTFVDVCGNSTMNSLPTTRLGLKSNSGKDCEPTFLPQKHFLLLPHHFLPIPRVRPNGHDTGESVSGQGIGATFLHGWSGSPQPLRAPVHFLVCRTPRTHKHTRWHFHPARTNTLEHTHTGWRWQPTDVFFLMYIFIFMYIAMYIYRCIYVYVNHSLTSSDESGSVFNACCLVCLHHVQVIRFKPPIPLLLCRHYEVNINYYNYHHHYYHYLT